MTFPDPSLLLAFFAGCFVTTLAFGIAEYRRKRKQDRWLRWASSLPPMTHGDPFGTRLYVDGKRVQ